jgi:ketosteroid isomerase-like protein
VTEPARLTWRCSRHAALGSGAVEGLPQRRTRLNFGVRPRDPWHATLTRPIPQEARLHRRLLLLATAAALAAACTPRPFPGAPAARADLQEREATFLAALAAKNPEQAAAHFADDAVLHVANMPPVQGRNAIREFYANIFRFLDSSVSASEVVRTSSSGDMGYSLGRVTNVFASEHGRMEYAGKYILVWERRGEQWLIATYSISNNQPEARP